MLGEQAHAPVALADDALEPVGCRDGVALAAAPACLVRVARELRGVDPGEPDAARSDAVDPHVDRVAVGNEDDLAGPDEAARLGPLVARDAPREGRRGDYRE